MCLRQLYASRHLLCGFALCCFLALLSGGALAASGSTPFAPTTPALGLVMSLQLQAPPPGAAASRADAPTAATAWHALLAHARNFAAPNRRDQATVQAAEAGREQARISAWLPRVDATAASSRRWQRYNDQPIETPAHSLGVTLTQPLWRPAERAAAVTQQWRAEQAQLEARAQHQAVARTMSMAWLQAVEAAESLRLSEATLTALAVQSDMVDRRLQAGVGTVLEQLEVRSQLALTRTRQETLRLRVATERLAVERLVGHPVHVPAGLRAMPADDPVVVPPLAESLPLIEQHNPSQLAGERQVAAARSALSGREAERWEPALSAVAEVSRTRQSQQFVGVSERQDIRNRAVGVQLNWPLFSSGLDQERVREALALLHQAEAQRDHVRGEVETALREAHETLDHSRRMLVVQRELAHTAEATHAAVQKAYLAGVRTHQDLLDARQQIDTSRQNLLRTRIQALKAQVGILSLLDRLDPEHVQALATVFEPGAYLEPAP